MNDEKPNYEDIIFENKLKQTIENLEGIFSDNQEVVFFIKSHFRLADNQSRIQSLYEEIQRLETENTNLLLIIDKMQNKL